MVSLQVTTQNVFLPVISKPSKSGSELAGHYLPRGRRKPGEKQERFGFSQTLLDGVLQGEQNSNIRSPEWHR